MWRPAKSAQKAMKYPAVAARTHKQELHTRGRKRAEDPAAARRILAAAERHFASKGLAGARTDEIAAAAGGNKAMLYYYYGDKQRLHRAVLENIFRQAMSSVEHAMPPNASPRDQLLAFIHGNFDFRARNPHYTQLFLRMMVESRDEVRWLAKNYLRPAHRRLSRIIERGMRSGQFRRVDSAQTVTSIIGMIAIYFSGATIQSEIFQTDVLGAEALARRKRAVLDFVNHALFLSEARVR